jgi:hypothetical protein
MAAQLPDIIVIDGERQDLYTNPLEQYWIVNKKKRPAFVTSTDCKRGYVATWELINHQLVLKNIAGVFEKKYFFFWKRIKPCSLRSILGKAAVKQSLATWFTGKLRLPKGNMIFYVHHDYESRFEQEMILTVDHGKIVKTMVLDYTHETLQLAHSNQY